MFHKHISNSSIRFFSAHSILNRNLWKEELLPNTSVEILSERKVFSTKQVASAPEGRSLSLLKCHRGGLGEGTAHCLGAAWVVLRRCQAGEPLSLLGHFLIADFGVTRSLGLTVLRFHLLSVSLGQHLSSHACCAEHAHMRT